MQLKFLRQTLLVRTILRENDKLTFKEIQPKILKEFEAYRDIEKLRLEEYPVSTFNKDKDAIRDAWKIEMECDSYNRYRISTDFEGAFKNDLVNSLILLSSLNADQLLPGYVVPETRKNTGLEFFHAISKAIENHQELTISYFDYISEFEKPKTIQPYILKQKDFKWYVLAVDKSAPEIPFKSFALERIRGIETGGKFKPKTIDFEAPFADAIGMFTNEEPQKILLQYDNRDGNYLKANPIHPSQKVVSGNNEKTVTFEFFVKPNEDFLMELQKRSWSLKILEPASLKEKMLKLWNEAVRRNLE